MQPMVDAGAKIIFATSYGYQLRLRVREGPPERDRPAPGRFRHGDVPPNFGTYFGEAYDPVSLGGMAAGAVTKSNKLGFVFAFPIPQTVDNVDAFELGAPKVNPAARPTWWPPRLVRPAQAEGGRLGAAVHGADVLTQHQDCQSTVIEAAKAANA